MERCVSGHGTVRDGSWSGAWWFMERCVSGHAGGWLALSGLAYAAGLYWL